MEILRDITVKETLDFLTKFYDDVKQVREWDIYLICFPNFTKDTFKTFEEWRKPVKIEPEKSNKETAANILLDIGLITKAVITKKEIIK